MFLCRGPAKVIDGLDPFSGHPRAGAEPGGAAQPGPTAAAPDRPAPGGILTPLPLCGFRRESRHRGISVEKIDEVGGKVAKSRKIYPIFSPQKLAQSADHAVQ